jgi:hypothetical protein
MATGREWFRRHRRQECGVARRVSPTAMAGSGAPAGPAVRRARLVDDELAAKIARTREFKKIPVPSEPAAAPKVVRYWVGNSRLGALREVVVAEPAPRDRWGRPTKQGLFR